jgi:hypothetical protein
MLGVVVVLFMAAKILYEQYRADMKRKGEGVGSAAFLCRYYGQGLQEYTATDFVWTKLFGGEEGDRWSTKQ